MSLPLFDLPTVRENSAGWGPTAAAVTTPSSSATAAVAAVIDEFKDLPFQQYNKCDRIGRVVDWLGDSRYYKKAESARYNERIYGSSATAGNQFDYVHDNEDANFQIVDSSKPQRPPQRYKPRQNLFVNYYSVKLLLKLCLSFRRKLFLNVSKNVVNKRNIKILN